MQYQQIKPAGFIHKNIHKYFFAMFAQCQSELLWLYFILPAASPPPDSF